MKLKIPSNLCAEACEYLNTQIHCHHYRQHTQKHKGTIITYEKPFHLFFGIDQFEICKKMR